MLASRIRQRLTTNHEARTVSRSITQFGSCRLPEPPAQDIAYRTASMVGVDADVHRAFASTRFDTAVPPRAAVGGIDTPLTPNGGSGRSSFAIQRLGHDRHIDPKPRIDEPRWHEFTARRRHDDADEVEVVGRRTRRMRDVLGVAVCVADGSLR